MSRGNDTPINKGVAKLTRKGTKYQMLFLDLSVETKRKIDRSLELICPDISLEGKEAFYDIDRQFSELECQDWIFRSCFVKDTKVTDDCVIIRFGDFWPEEGLRGVNADVAAQRMFGSFARDAMLDRMILSVVSLIMGRGSDENSFLNFAKNHCSSDIRKKIWNALKIEEEILELEARCCPHCKATLKGKIRKEKYSCKIEGFDNLKTYRDKRAAHRDRKYGLGDIRLQYRIIEDCIQGVCQAMQVVYPDADFSVDWRKRSDIISRDYLRHPPWTTNPGEPRIVQNLKELAIRRLRDKLGSLQSLDPCGTNQSVQKKMDEICDEIEKIRAS